MSNVFNETEDNEQFSTCLGNQLEEYECLNSYTEEEKIA